MLSPEPQHQWALQIVLLSMSKCYYLLIKLHINLLASFLDFVSTRGSTRFRKGALPRLLPVGIVRQYKNVVLKKVGS